MSKYEKLGITPGHFISSKTECAERCLSVFGERFLDIIMLGGTSLCEEEVYADVFAGARLYVSSVFHDGLADICLRDGRRVGSVALTPMLKLACEIKKYPEIRCTYFDNSSGVPEIIAVLLMQEG